MSGVEGAGGDDDAWLYGEEGEEDPKPSDKVQETTEGEGVDKDNETEEQMESEENAHAGENGDSNIVEGNGENEENTENEPPAQSPGLVLYYENFKSYWAIAFDIFKGSNNNLRSFTNLGLYINLLQCTVNTEQI